MQTAQAHRPERGVRPRERCVRKPLMAFKTTPEVPKAVNKGQNSPSNRTRPVETSKTPTIPHRSQLLQQVPRSFSSTESPTNRCALRSNQNPPPKRCVCPVRRRQLRRWHHPARSSAGFDSAPIRRSTRKPRHGRPLCWHSASPPQGCLQMLRASISSARGGLCVLAYASLFQIRGVSAHYLYTCGCELSRKPADLGMTVRIGIDMPASRTLSAGGFSCG